ncbi:hypothetical protein [Sporisorium scitamineum]|uniref:Uncharacterized protein n=1 Tax=Sporisorium scitamineum TaxID=49012 RepID=A0A0F7SDB3_9BASI|nr:hypothetical protein [Sporisorium scitamineum]
MTLGRGVEPPFAGLLPNMKAADPFYWTKASSFGFTWQSSPYLAQPWSWANQNVGPSNSMSLSQGQAVLS